MLKRKHLIKESFQMAKTLHAKHAKQFRDKARAYKEGKVPADCKVAVARSKKAKKKNANRAY
jgi:hypothetical protein